MDSYEAEFNEINAEDITKGMTILYMGELQEVTDVEPTAKGTFITLSITGRGYLSAKASLIRG